MLRLILSLLQPSGGSYHVCAGDNHRTQIEMSPSTRKLFSYVPQGNTHVFPVRLQKICETSNQMPPTKKSSTPCSWHVPGISWKSFRTAFRAWSKNAAADSPKAGTETFHCQALLRHSPILLLDEATSALDVATERKVLKNIMQDTYPRTCIVTTHRPTVLNICTRVLCDTRKKM